MNSEREVYAQNKDMEMMQLTKQTALGLDEQISSHLSCFSLHN